MIVAADGINYEFWTFLIVIVILVLMLAPYARR